MAHRVERLPLGAGTPGTRREVLVHRFGTPGARPKAYFQAALHADEIPAILVAHHLVRRLAEAEGLIEGEVVVVPFANLAEAVAELEPRSQLDSLRLILAPANAAARREGYFGPPRTMAAIWSAKRTWLSSSGA